ncbi:hypothetical protein ACJRO7_022128 [Eucalyptus globulus]|uniref:Alpha-ketoglutarate-dependent dioxygenase AlkB-like domain-containing protein n=1 Tax=Eucalyptus globulus TaxID=34317 RepID=A0ABD3KM58_EUCGL
MNSLMRKLTANADPAPSTPSPSEFDPSESVRKGKSFDLGHGSEVFHVPRFFPAEQSWAWFDYLNKHVPWSRPTLRIFGRNLVQPRDSCYVAAEGLPAISYNGHSPRAYSWDDFPPLKDILDAVHKALPGSRFNSLVLNRYDGNNDYVSWHSDDEVLYGPTPEIASVTFGCEREFLLKKKPSKMSPGITQAHLWFMQVVTLKLHWLFHFVGNAKYSFSIFILKLYFGMYFDFALFNGC